MEQDISWLSTVWICPNCRSELTHHKNGLTCNRGHHYELIHGIPILLDPSRTLHVQIQKTDLQKLANEHPAFHSDEIDPFVRKVVGATNGIMYESIAAKLKHYPVPGFILPESKGERLIDLGCNWGRWSIAAARKGYRVVGLDPNPQAIFAARRIADQLGIEATYLVADARSLPFKAETFQVVYSYSVLQHFSKEDVRVVLNEVQRVLVQDGQSCIEMANALGLRSLYHQLRRGFRVPTGFEVRYWTPVELRSTYHRYIGKSTLAVDGFFSLNPQKTDTTLLPWRYRLVVHLSETLKGVARFFPLLSHFADSLFVFSKK